MTLEQRLDALKESGVIAGWEAPHPNRGLAGGMLPWVIMPIDEGPAALFYTDAHVLSAIVALEMFGPMRLTGRGVRGQS